MSNRQPHAKVKVKKDTRTMRPLRGTPMYPNTTELNDNVYRRLMRAGGWKLVTSWLAAKGRIMAAVMKR